MQVGPTPLSDRIAAIDWMRGFALLGILIVNMLAFHSPFYYIDPFTWYRDIQEFQAFQYIDIFVQASFYPLFSMLFGYGLVMQMERLETRGQAYKWIMIRRLLILLVFGIIHAFFIWSGDILITYAISGFLVMWLLRLSARWLLGLGKALYVLPNLAIALLLFVAAKMGTPFYTGIQEINNSILAFAKGSYSDIFMQRAADWYYANIESGTLLLIVISIVPFMLIGAAAAKWKLVERAQLKAKFWIFLAIFSLAAGFVLKSLPYVIEPNLFYVFVQDTFGGPLVAVGYASIFVLLSTLPVMHKIVRPLGYVGRMSMTIYLMQSIIATTIFYNYGLGLYGKVDIQTGTWLAIAIFIVQMIFAELWFMKFKYGPIEWLWRKGTYGKFMKKTIDEK